MSRDLDETYLDRVRGYHATESYAKAMRKRSREATHARQMKAEGRVPFPPV